MPPQRKPGSALKALRSVGFPAKPKAGRRDHFDSDQNELSPARLQDQGVVRSLADRCKPRDVGEIMQYVLDNMFEEIPERAGMNSVRIAQLLNFRRSLPPLVTTTHVHALSEAATTTEREIAQLVRQGAVRKLFIPGRGLGATGIGEFLVLTDRWKEMVISNLRLSQSVKEKYIRAICEKPDSVCVPSSFFTQQETIELVQAGFLTSASGSSAPGVGLSSQVSGRGSLSSLASAGSRAPAGSVEAVGGEGAVHNAGGSGILNHATGSDHQLNFSVPSMGLHLRLLAASREHLVSLLGKSDHHEAPVDLLRQRWDGGVTPEDTIRYGRATSRSVLPGRTRKWKQFYGVNFQWILEECFSTGAIELFETGAVGLGARVPA